MECWKEKVMPTQLAPSLATHLRSGRYAQRERPAASIPSRIQARRVERDSRRETNGNPAGFRFFLFGVA
jgi:hypothetical protein